MRLQNASPLVGLFASVFMTAAAFAQYVGPSTTPAYRSVADVLKSPTDGAPVAFEGYIVRQVGKEKYIFSDRISEIRIEIDQKHFPATPINENTKVRIRGEIEKDFLESPEIDVEFLAVIN